MKHKILILAISALIAQYSFSQCVDCLYSSQVTSSSTIGRYNTSLGTGSIIIGINSQTGDLASNSIAMGSYVKTIAGLSFVIGHGINSSYMLENNMNRTLMVGFNSNLPTFFVSRSLGLNTTGKIAIGNVVNEGGYMDPQAKLHLRSDEEEIAAILIEPNSWAEGSGGSSSGGAISDNKAEGSLYENGAYLFLGNSNHGVGAVSNLGLLFKSESNYIFGEGRVGINTAEPRHTLHVNGSIFTNEFILYDAHNIPRSGYVLVSDDEGKGYWVNPLANGVGLWKVNEDNSDDIYYNSGNVGIGTMKTFGYKLAVNGIIMAEEIRVKLYNEWPDFVFEKNYDLKSLEYVEDFINTLNPQQYSTK